MQEIISNSNSQSISRSDIMFERKETEVFIFDEPDPHDHT